MNLNNVHERWAQALVLNAMDIAKAWDVVYPDGPNSRLKSAKSKISKFNELIAPNPAVWARVVELQRKVDEKLSLSAADVIEHWATVATADRRKLVSVVDVPCRACKGSGMDSVTEDDCECCGGEGTLGQRVRIAATETYGPEEIAVYEGAEQTKTGIKLTMASKAAAWEALARHFGLFNDKLLLAKAGAPPELPPLPDDPLEAARLYAEWVKS